MFAPMDVCTHSLPEFSFVFILSFMYAQNYSYVREVMCSSTLNSTVMYPHKRKKLDAARNWQALAGKPRLPNHS